jgi:peroxiredoxin Q/BCP
MVSEKKVVKKVVKKVSKVALKKPDKLPAKVLGVGAVIPDIVLSSDTMGEVRLRGFIGKKSLLLFFYPKDNTPGCTREACGFQANLKKIEKCNVAVIGVSPDSLASHDKFRKKYSLEFPLLSDSAHALAKACGVWVEKSMYGRTYMGIQRSTFLFSKEGKLVHVWPKVSVDGHDEDVLAVIKSKS